jgi:membrane protease YdiL (CAAX protease family)
MERTMSTSTPNSDITIPPIPQSCNVDELPPPRIWTVFVAFAAALLGAIVMQIVAVAGFLIWEVARGTDLQTAAQTLQTRITEPRFFLILLALGQLAIASVAVVAGSCSRQPTRVRLGLVRASVPLWGYPVIAVSALVPFRCGLWCAHLLEEHLPADQSAVQAFNQMTWDIAVPWILLIALAPAFSEELLFRGFMQRRLLERWSPLSAILVTSILFTLMHITPILMVAVFPLGLWFGILAWRTGSVWPGIVCHAFINGSWNIFQISLRLAPLPEPSLPEVLLTLGPVAVACFGLTINWIARSQSSKVSVPAVSDSDS